MTRSVYFLRNATRELGMKKGASARSWGNLEDPNRTALIKTESFGTSEKYMSARI